MKNLKITTVQSILYWEDIQANLSMFDKKLEGLEGTTDLIILPEMFTTGFSMAAARLAEKMDGQTMRWLKDKAKKSGAVVTGSFVAEDNGGYFNRLVWMRPDGTYEYYDKRHLFTLAGEHEAYQPGAHKLVVEWKGWRVCPMICYDLRFPVWSRNTEGYDLLIYVANWPDKRSYHWVQLLIGRAIENQSYVVGVNRVGHDGQGLDYTGDTSLVDFTGKALYQVSGQEDIFTAELKYQDLKSFRKKLAFLDDQDKFQIFT